MNRLHEGWILVMLCGACGGGGFELATPVEGVPVDDASVEDATGDGFVLDAIEPDAMPDALDAVLGEDTSPDGARDATTSGDDARADANAPDAIVDTGNGTFPPSNADLFGRFAKTGAAVTIERDITFDTSNACVSSRSLGTCTLATIKDRNEACVCRNDGMLIAGRVQVIGARALVLLASGSVRFTANGAISVSTGTSADGPGALLGEDWERESYATRPARGGSFGSQGGGLSPRPPYGDASLIPLFGGMRGESSTTARGGGGGGAVQISSTEEIVVDGFVAANGGGGGGGTRHRESGAGGGSGGAILLEAPRVRIAGILAANGGGGGASAEGPDTWQPGAPGASGMRGATPAAGGKAIGCETGARRYGASGGPGAASATASPPGRSGEQCGNSDDFWGGSGGGVGRIRINTSSGALEGTGVISPPATFGRLR